MPVVICLSIVIIGLVTIYVKKLTISRSFYNIPQSNIKCSTSPNMSRQNSTSPNMFKQNSTSPNMSRQDSTSSSKGLVTFLELVELRIPKTIENVNLDSSSEKIPHSIEMAPKSIFNNRKYNENLISFMGVLVLIVILIVILVPIAYHHFTNGVSEYDNNVNEFVVLYFYILLCCLPVALPSIYFISNPRHLTIVLHLFWINKEYMFITKPTFYFGSSLFGFWNFFLFL